MKKFTLILGLAITLFTLAYFFTEGVKVVNYSESGTIFTDVRRTADSSLVLMRLDSTEFVSMVHPSIGDTISSVADSSATLERWNTYFFSVTEPGQVIPIEFLRAGMEFRAELKTHLPYAMEFIPLLMMEVVRFFLVISFIAVGLYAFFSRPDSGGVRALTLFSYTMALFMMTGIIALGRRYVTINVPYFMTITQVMNYLVPLFGSFWLNLQMLFPKPHNYIVKKPFLTYFFIYLPYPIIVSLNLVYRTNLDVALLFIIFLQIIVGIYILQRSYASSESGMEKRQIRMVMIGSGIGLASLFILISIAIIFNEWFVSWRWNSLLVTFSFIALLLSPLSFAYSFQRYRLLEVEGKLRRGTRYFIVTAGLLIIFVSVIYTVGELLIRNLGITSRAPTLMVAVVLALGFTPALRRIQTSIERRFFPERYNLKESVRDFSQKLLSITDCKSLWKQIESILNQSIGIKNIYPVLRDNNGGGFYLDGEAHYPTPFNYSHGLVMIMSLDPRPMLVEEAISNTPLGLTIPEEMWLKERNITLLLPMMMHSTLMGFIGLGKKENDEDFSPEEALIFASLASQLGMACENILLIEENITKKRMEEELLIARKIQRGFLPSVIPRVPGLSLCAVSHFCLEVAGDYYDVIPLAEGGTVLAVGDVSGKGAGAALIMANLQASLRTAVGVGAELKSIVGRINDLIFMNTPPEQYITFFVSLFDHHQKRLSYVNAGHNPPLVFHWPSGEVAELEDGGLILGFLPGMNYRQGEIQLGSGDMILMFTDGVSEAMNASEEEYGLERMASYIRTHIEESPQAILSGLEKEVKLFTGDAGLADDFTMILAKVD